MAEPIFNPSMAAFLQRSLSPQRQRALSLAAAMRDGSLNPGAAGNGESVMGPMPQMPPTLSGVENMGVEQRVHHSNYQPRDAGRFVAGAPEWPELPQEGPPRLRTEPGPPPTSAQNMALEMTGLPSAMRGSQSLARARETGDPMDVVRGVGQVAAAGPGRGGLAGFLLSEAAAQTPDPRQKRIKEIDDSIRARERVIKDYANKQFPTRQGRTDATKVEQDAITTLQNERKGLQDRINDAAQAEIDRKLADVRGAAWRNTPTATAYPGVQYGSAGAGALGSAYLAFRGARAPVRQFNQRTQSTVDRQKAAIDRANDNTLSVAERNQARRTAEAAQREYDAAVAAQPHLTLRDRLTAGGLSGAGTDIGMMAPTIADYIYSFQDPEGSLHGYSEGQLNPLANPGRFGVGAVTGGFAGMLGQEIGERFPGVRVPPSYGAETEGLPSRYQAPRKPATPRKRK